MLHWIGVYCRNGVQHEGSNTSEDCAVSDKFTGGPVDPKKILTHKQEEKAITLTPQQSKLAHDVGDTCTLSQLPRTEVLIALTYVINNYGGTPEIIELILNKLKGDTNAND